MTIHDAHQKFITRIGVYNGFLFQTETHFKTILKSERDFSEKINKNKFIRPILGYKLIYRNLLTTNYEIQYLHSINDRNIEESLEILKINYFNFVIAQCFECFETFLKDIIASYLYINPIIFTGAQIQTDSFKTCRESLSLYCKQKNKYNRKLFNQLYLISPEIDKLEADNFLQFNFKKWYVVLTEMRHSIIHANGQFKIKLSKDWTKFHISILDELFIYKTENEIGFISTVSDYRYIIEKIAQHGQIIYDCVKKSSPKH